MVSFCLLDKVNKIFVIFVFSLTDYHFNSLFSAVSNSNGSS